VLLTSVHANLLEWLATYFRPSSNQWNGPDLGTSQFRPPSTAAIPTIAAMMAPHASTIHRLGFNAALLLRPWQQQRE
jgi:hypothetical protein